MRVYSHGVDNISSVIQIDYSIVVLFIGELQQRITNTTDGSMQKYW